MRNTEKPIKEHRLTVRMDDETRAKLKAIQKLTSSAHEASGISAAIRTAIHLAHEKMADKR